ncbi:GntR family transcriptional regulator [Terribacillus saccharophilus]|uniref:GntR family transcriptional regulator n=1 Tax=Terribacillus saccharophilus TaxID=361277 RepID=UPI001C3EC63C|nr:GntR family transcriptional regulator [Terribacillus saccharophilus]
METNSSLFNIDHNSPYPINIQIREQIKWLIGKGLLKPGESLPSTNLLANQLSINRNTIQSVYTHLKDEGLLQIQKGRGTHVAEELAIEKFKASSPHLQFAEQFMKDAADLGYDVEQVLLSAYAYIKLFGQPMERKSRYLFVECKVSACVFYLDEIKKMTDAEIVTIDVSSTSVKELNEEIGLADIVVTRADLYDKVKSFSKDDQKTIISVGSTKDVSLLLKMLRH